MREFKVLRWIVMWKNVTLLSEILKLTTFLKWMIENIQLMNIFNPRFQFKLENSTWEGEFYQSEWVKIINSSYIEN